MAMTAATLATLSGSRFQLGLGISNSHTAEVWHGVSFERPLARTREYVDIVRMALAGDEVRYAGELFQIPLAGRTGNPFRMPSNTPIPVHLAAVGPRNLHLTGLVADGWIGVFSSPERISEILPLILAGRDASGRPRESFEMNLTAGVSVDDDPEKASLALKPHAARFMSIGHREKNFYFSGWPPEWAWEPRRPKSRISMRPVKSPLRRQLSPSHSWTPPDSSARWTGSRRR